MSHPYFPKDLQVWNYVPNDKSQLELLITFGTVFACTSAFLYRLGQRSGSPLKFVWFAICACLHCGFEVYYILNVGTITSKNTILAQLWKEYGKGDSRYMIHDTHLITMESITILIYGPLCIYTAYLILSKSNKQYFFQLITSVCHAVSCTIYYVSELPDASHCDPQPIYFWGYFVMMNMPWIVVPVLCIVQSYKHINQAFENKIKSK